MGPVISTQKEYRSLKKIFAVWLYRIQVAETVSVAAVVDLRGEISGKDRLRHEHFDFFQGWRKQLHKVVCSREREELEFGGRAYKLDGIAFHHGKGSGYGHYTCLVKRWSHLHDDWFHINDDKCHRVLDKKKMFETVNKGAGDNFTSYLVIYHRDSWAEDHFKLVYSIEILYILIYYKLWLVNTVDLFVDQMLSSHFGYWSNASVIFLILRFLAKYHCNFWAKIFYQKT